MATENGESRRKVRYMRQPGGADAVYGLGIFGAWFYYFTHATTFMMGLIGFFKGIFWPAFVVYELMKFLGM